MRFIIIGDTKGKKNGINEKVLKSILATTCKLSPMSQFIVICGDSVAGSQKEEELAAQLINYRSLIKSYHPTIPIIPVIGNHEVYINPSDAGLEKVFSRAYSDFEPDNFIQAYNKTVYYWDYIDTRFFVLNAFHYGEIHQIINEQLNWFEEKALGDKKNKIVFVHSPAFPTGAHLNHCLDFYPEQRDAFWKVIDRCGIDIVFSGHEHNYSRRIIDSTFNIDYKRSINQIITGGGGEKLNKKYKSKQGVIVAPIDVYHFLVVDIEPLYIKVSAISSHGKKLDEFKIDKNPTSK